MNRAEFLEKLKLLKTRYKSDLRIDGGSLGVLVMNGTMDSMFEEPATVAQRFEFIEEIKKALGSKAEINEIADIETEFDRQLYMSKANPVHQFNVCKFYHNSMAAMGYNEFLRAGSKVRYIKNDTDLGKIHVFGTLNDLFSPSCVDFYSNRNCQATPATVMVYLSYSTKSYGAGKQMKKLLFTDGVSEIEAVLWPKYGTDDEFSDKLLNKMKMYKRGSPCLVKCKIKANGNFRSMTLVDMINLEMLD